MKICENTSLLPNNTFGIDIKAEYFVEYSSIEELNSVLKSDNFKSKQLLHIGSGSNLLFLKDFDGVILHSAIQSITLINEDKNTVYIEVGSGVVWDDFVAYCVNNNWSGIENLSLIPGEIGASAVQNIGAYGVEVQDVIAYVNTLEVATGNERKFTNAECKYSYRESIFKKELKGKYIITSVVFKLDKKAVFNLNYQQLEQEVKKNGEINLHTIRRTIINIRESKLPNTKTVGNAGSFFMNPIISKLHFDKLQTKYPQLPHYFVSDTEEKVPAAWLIDQCGWKGKQIGNAAVHDKQALVLINKGNATGSEIVHLAEQIQQSVIEKFDIQLIPEVNYI